MLALSKLLVGRNASINQQGVHMDGHSQLCDLHNHALAGYERSGRRSDTWQANCPNCSWRLRGSRCDFVARGTIAVPIAVWSIVCPWFWYSGFEGYLLIVPLGAYIIWGLYTDRSFKGDRRSWKLWTLWTALLVSYHLPATG